MKAYGVETLRLWVASVDCTGEMSIGTEILNRTEEMHRKIRNTLRYCLGSLEDRKLSQAEKIPREEMTPVRILLFHVKTPLNPDLGVTIYYAQVVHR